MKVVCIKSMHKNGLKNGIQRLFTKDVFQSISEWREKRLNDLGI